MPNWTYQLLLCFRKEYLKFKGVAEVVITFKKKSTVNFNMFKKKRKENKTKQNNKKEKVNR